MSDREYIDVSSTGDGREPEPVRSELNENMENYAKKTFGEKRTISVQEKLKTLSEKYNSNPPRTVIGNKLAKIRLDRLSNIVDRRILVNNRKNLERLNEYSIYSEYFNSEQTVKGIISDLMFKKEGILRQIQELRYLDPNSKGSIFSENDKIIQKNMPKGYKPAENEQQASNGEIANRIKILEDRLEEIERLLDENYLSLENNHEIYNQKISESKAELKQDLATIRPNFLKKAGTLFRNIGSFFKDKKDKFVEWRKQRKENATGELRSTIDANTGSSKKVMLSSLLTEYSLEEQNRFAKETQKELAERQDESEEKPENDKTI